MQCPRRSKPLCNFPVLVDIGVHMGLAIASIHQRREEFRKELNPGGRARRWRDRGTPLTIQTMHGADLLTWKWPKGSVWPNAAIGANGR